MSLEPGGRADKRGNSYENRFLAKLLLRLVEEKISSIEVEPLGVDGVGIEFITTDSSGVRTFYQCKSSSADSSYWTYGSLSKYNVFFNAKTQLDRDSKGMFCF